MTAWTSEPPREGAWHWWRYDNGEATVLHCVDIEGAWEPRVDLRSVHPIPRAEVLAAMHEVCDAARLVSRELAARRANYAMVVMDSALRALEEARRG
jgi:hypothetical protein